MAVSGNMLYDKVVSIAEDYFGPAAPRFINRLITNHLGKAPVKITARDIPDLAVWVSLTVAMLTDDQDTIDQFTKRLHQLTTPQRAASIR